MTLYAQSTRVPPLAGGRGLQNQLSRTQPRRTFRPDRQRTPHAVEWIKACPELHAESSSTSDRVRPAVNYQPTDPLAASPRAAVPASGSLPRQSQAGPVCAPPPARPPHKGKIRSVRMSLLVWRGVGFRRGREQRARPRWPKAPREFAVRHRPDLGCLRHRRGQSPRPTSPSKTTPSLAHNY